jgi:hypothetical protein
MVVKRHNIPETKKKARVIAYCSPQHFTVYEWMSCGLMGCKHWCPAGMCVQCCTVFVYPAGAHYFRYPGERETRLDICVFGRREKTPTSCTTRGYQLSNFTSLSDPWLLLGLTFGCSSSRSLAAPLPDPGCSPALPLAVPQPDPWLLFCRTPSCSSA